MFGHLKRHVHEWTTRISGLFFKKKITIVKGSEKATSASVGFHAGPLSWSKWNLVMLIKKCASSIFFISAVCLLFLVILAFDGRGGGGKPEKNSRNTVRTNSKLSHI